ncbi:hypothetical protein AB0O07_08465 [Streptomyces sp. NPDC093085]|uniref:hypothetical protein n=1 Tax=Streptomyces sp. NPDC093085 TaxID=3155068 RepID=UPI00342F346E
MTTLPRAFWGHVDFVGDSPLAEPLNNLTTTAPGTAVNWVRESVRQLSPTLDRETFHYVWGWLGDHRAVNAAVLSLRRGTPYGFALETSIGLWTWSVRPVSVLPAIDTCSKRPWTEGELSVLTWSSPAGSGPLPLTFPEC